MRSLPTHSPSNVAALDPRDPNAGSASHCYGIQHADPKEVVRIQFQHGARRAVGSVSGIFDDDLLAILEDRLVGFESGPFACEENAEALQHIRKAREALGRRVATRMSQGILGVNQAHAKPGVPGKE